MHVGREASVQRDKKIDGAARLARDALQIVCHQRRRWRLDQKRRELTALGCFVLEGEALRVGFQEKIEWIQYRHLGDQIHFDAQFPSRLREHDARQVVRLRILLPVDEVLGRV